MDVSEKLFIKRENINRKKKKGGRGGGGAENLDI